MRGAFPARAKCTLYEERCEVAANKSERSNQQHNGDHTDTSGFTRTVANTSRSTAEYEDSLLRDVA